MDGSSAVAPELELEVEPLPEVLPLEGGVLLEPPAEDDVLGEVLDPPLAELESFFAGSVVEDEELEEDEGELLGPDAEPDGELGVVVPDAEPEAEPDGELGVVAEPEEEVAPEPGAAPRLPALSPQPVSMLAPSAMEIATAKADSLI